VTTKPLAVAEFKAAWQLKAMPAGVKHRGSLAACAGRTASGAPADTGAVAVVQLKRAVRRGSGKLWQLRAASSSTGGGMAAARK
jgi:hypothetical protein